MNKNYYRVLLLIPVMSLLGCVSRPQPAPPVIASGRHAELVQVRVALQRAGIESVSQGDQIRFVIPVQPFFQTGTNKIKPKRVYALRLIGNVILAARGAPVSVIGYTDLVGTPKARMQRSYDNAKVIASYFWDQGVASKRVRILGLGSAYPIAGNYTPKGAMQNRRVEVWIY